jgi:hypothetical protein
MARLFQSCLLLIFLSFASKTFAADLNKRISIESKIAVKKVDAKISINDIRQTISGHFLLRDTASIYEEPIGKLTGNYWIIGKSCGGWTTSGSGEFVVFQESGWECEMPTQGNVHVKIGSTQTCYDKTGSGKYGYEYYGYLITVEAPDGGIIMVKSSQKEYEVQVDAFKKLKANISFNKDLIPQNKISWFQ